MIRHQKRSAWGFKGNGCLLILKLVSGIIFYTANTDSGWILWEADSEMALARRVDWNFPLGSTPGKGREGKQDCPEGKSGLGCRSAIFSLTHAELQNWISRVVPWQPEVARLKHPASAVIRREPYPEGQDPMQLRLCFKRLRAGAYPPRAFLAAGTAGPSWKGNWDEAYDFVTTRCFIKYKNIKFLWNHKRSEEPKQS